MRPVEGITQSIGVPRLNAVLSRVADHTILYRRGNLILVTFGAFATVGAFLWMWITGSCLLAHGLTRVQGAIFLLGGALSVLLLAHGFWWLGHLSALIRQPRFGIRNIGFVSWGGFAGAIAFAAGFALICGFPLMTICDDLLRGMFAAYAIGRVGCLTYGCCYGKPARRFGVCYRNPAAKVIREQGESVGPRHATQIYSSAEGVALFVLLNTISCYHVPAGFITVVAFLTYPPGRAFIELYRDRKRYLGSRFTSGHLACAVAFLAGWISLPLIIHAGGALAPTPLTLGELEQGLTLAPVIAFISLCVFFAMGFHWKRVGNR